MIPHGFMKTSIYTFHDFMCQNSKMQRQKCFLLLEESTNAYLLKSAQIYIIIYQRIGEKIVDVGKCMLEREIGKRKRGEGE